MIALLRILSLAALVSVIGCAPKAQQVEHREIPNDGKFQDKKDKFAVEYPEPWTERRPTGGEDVLLLKRKDYKGEISVAVPKLPPHIPGLIPLQSVEKGYIDDVKKRLKDVVVTESKPVKISGAFGRQFALTGVAPDGKRTIAALTLLKGDTLYIMSAESPANEAEDARDAFEQIARSWKWLE
jgi:hypothetical protein